MRHGISGGAAGRVIIVSNRLPVVPVLDGANVVLRPACGGLATGLRDVHEAKHSLWIGSSGEWWQLSPSQQAATRRDLRERRICPVPLTPDETAVYYDGVCNSVLWPLLHSQIDRIPRSLPEWEIYRTVNERFADAIAAEYRSGDVIWVHDYHLLLVPGLLRRRIPNARIGFFLHVPFPPPEIFAVAPWRREILEGLVGASLVGFHTRTYAAHFAAAVEQLTQFEVLPDTVLAHGREVRVDAYPMSVDVAAFEQLARDPAVRALRTALRSNDRTQLLVGVDRLDYTKGIPRRLLAYEALLREHSDLRGRVRLIQVAVPSRDTVPSYQRFRHEIDALVGRVNGDYGTLQWTPIRYLHQAVSRQQLAALYLAADAMLVTPLRDGMNLVSKEFVATRIDEDGVLVLSEFAGAAEELAEAVQVNPYAIEATAEALRSALAMRRGERQSRMRALRAQVTTCDVHAWASHYLFDLATAGVASVPASSQRVRSPELDAEHAHTNVRGDAFVA